VPAGPTVPRRPRVMLVRRGRVVVTRPASKRNHGDNRASADPIHDGLAHGTSIVGARTQPRGRRGSRVCGNLAARLAPP
jgi:hypothetical protein